MRQIHVAEGRQENLQVLVYVKASPSSVQSQRTPGALLADQMNNPATRDSGKSSFCPDMSLYNGHTNSGKLETAQLCCM